MSYSTARSEGEQEGTERFATVAVLLDVGPRFDDRRSLNDPNVRRVMRQQAAIVADGMFKSYHPDAEVEHDEDEEGGAAPTGEAQGPAGSRMVEI